MKKEYYYIDVDTKSKKIIEMSKTTKASLSGDTENKNVHRVFLTKGQFNKLSKKF